MMPAWWVSVVLILVGAGAAIVGRTWRLLRDHRWICLGCGAGRKGFIPTGHGPGVCSSDSDRAGFWCRVHDKAFWGLTVAISELERFRDDD